MAAKVHAWSHRKWCCVLGNHSSSAPKFRSTTARILNRVECTGCCRFSGSLAVFWRLFFLMFPQSLWLALLSSEDASHRDWRNVRKNNLQNTAKEPKNPQQPLDPGHESLREVSTVRWIECWGETQKTRVLIYAEPRSFLGNICSVTI